MGRSQSVQGMRVRKALRKTIGRCESEPGRAKKTHPGRSTIEELFPVTVIAPKSETWIFFPVLDIIHSNSVGIPEFICVLRSDAIVGPDKGVRAKESNKKGKQKITSTLRNLKYLKDARAEYQILRYCGVTWARYFPTRLCPGAEQ